MAVTPRIHTVAVEEVGTFTERYPGYRAALVKALDEVVAQQFQSHTPQRRGDVAKVVDALGRSAVIAAGGES